MLIVWINSQGRECAATFTREDEARNFIEDLRTRHGAREIQLLDADGVRLEAYGLKPRSFTGRPSPVE